MDPDLLEPLGVDVGGVIVAPEPVAHELHVRDLVPTRHEVVEAIRATVSDAQAARALTPWLSAPPDVRPAPAKYSASFFRMLALSPAGLDELPAWWRAHAEHGRVVIARNLWIGEPCLRPPRTWCLPGRLRGIAVDVLLWPHLGIWTKLSVEPRRRVRTGRRYFRRGHRALDVLGDRLIREL
jgi:hypothetical protein